MKLEAEKVEILQQEIETVHEKRREVCLEPAGLKDDNVVMKMHQDFTDFSEQLQNNEDEVVRLGRLLTEKDSDADEILMRSKALQDNVEDDWEVTEKETEEGGGEANLWVWVWVCRWCTVLCLARGPQFGQQYFQ